MAAYPRHGAAGNMKVLWLLLSSNHVYVNGPCHDSRTPVRRAASDEQIKLVRLLLDIAHEIDIDADDWLERTLLHWAAGKGQLETVPVLLLRPNVQSGGRDDSWSKSLWEAVSSGHLPTTNGITPLYLAGRKANGPMSMLLPGMVYNHRDGAGVMEKNYSLLSRPNYPRAQRT